MKKIILLICVVMLGQNIMAQDNFREEYLPKQGDIALGFDVLPVFRYLGNAFNGNTANSLDQLGGTPTLDSKLARPTVSIMGKYMLTDDIAVRGNIGFLADNQKHAFYVTDQKAVELDPLSEDKVTDWYRTHKSGMNLALGAEYRRGYKRVQGFFGGSVLFATQREKVTIDWGNQMTELNTMPEYHANMGSYVDGSRRYMEMKKDTERYLGLVGHVGVEYFITPKVALGAEVNLTMYKQFGVQQYNKYEEFVVANNKVEEKTDLIAPGNSAFYIGTDNVGGSVYLMFYF